MSSSTAGTGDLHGLRQRLFLLFECERPLATSMVVKLDQFDKVVIGRGRERAFTAGQEGALRTLAVRIPDQWMSTLHVRLTRAGDRWLAEDAGSKNGTKHNEAILLRATLNDGDVIELGQTFFLYREQPAHPPFGGPPILKALDLASPAPEFLSLSPRVRALYAQIAQAAPSDAPMLLVGEPGVGKATAARVVHRLSSRVGPFSLVTAGAGLEPALEGAKQGTLFIEALESLSPADQALLLQVLEGEAPEGASGPVRSVRVVAGSTEEPAAAVSARLLLPGLAQAFGQSGVVARLPPLRERREDLGVLIARMLTLAQGAERVALGVKFGRALLQHPWPQNIRELERAVEAAVAAGRDASVDLALASRSLTPSNAEPRGLPSTPDVGEVKRTPD